MHDPVSTLLDAAHGFHHAAEIPGSHTGAPESLASLQEALQVLSAAWYRVAADAVPMERRKSDLSREQEVTLIAALHDVAAAFARGARACRKGRAVAGALLTPRLSADGFGAERVEDGLSWFAGRQLTERVER